MADTSEVFWVRNKKIFLVSPTTAKCTSPWPGGVELDGPNLRHNGTILALDRRPCFSLKPYRKIYKRNLESRILLIIVFLLSQLRNKISIFASSWGEVIPPKK
jgi:hypothetical protein